MIAGDISIGNKLTAQPAITLHKRKENIAA